MQIKEEMKLEDGSREVWWVDGRESGGEAKNEDDQNTLYSILKELFFLNWIIYMCLR